MYTQLGMFQAETATAQQEASSAASLTMRQFCKSCRRAPSVQCDKCKTWRKDYDSLRACLLSAWPAHYSHADSVTLRLRGPFGDVIETGTERHVREYRSLLNMAGVAQEGASPPLAETVKEKKGG